jgi:hypothetical protein
MQRLSPQEAEKPDDMMCTAKKISLRRNARAIVQATKNPERQKNRERAPENRGNAQGNKNKSRRPWKRECNSARGTAFAAIIRAANTGGGLHRFFECARYFHDARVSGIVAALPPAPGDFMRGGFDARPARRSTV